MDIKPSFGATGSPLFQPTSSGEAKLAEDKTTDLITKVVPSAMQMVLTDTKQTSSGTVGKVLSTQTSGIGGLLGMAGKGFGILGGITGAIDIVSKWGKSSPAQGAMSGAALGAAVGSFFPGVGTAIGGALGSLVGGMIGSIKVGKHADQKARDSVRAAMVERGFLDANYTMQLANGGSYNMGLDGGPKAELGGRRPFEVDFNNPLTAQTVAWINPIADLLTGGDEKLKTDFAGYFTNAALTGAKSLDEVAVNVVGMMQQMKISPAALKDWVMYSGNSGRYQGNEGAVHLGSVETIGKYFEALKASASTIQ
jgi:hypothetical protein